MLTQLGSWMRRRDHLILVHTVLNTKTIFQPDYIETPCCFKKK